MRLLVIGGTVFLGRAVVENALTRGHEVTVFHRGLHGRGANPDAETIIGDRTKDLSALEGRAWDAVIDTCGFEPEHVGASAGLLARTVEHYGFVSSCSAYADWPGRPVDEGSALFTSEAREYGPLKAACERAAEAAMPGRVLHARAGIIVGPHENLGRLPWWLRRLAAGGEVLAPGPAAAPIQLIDARDLAGWMLDMAQARTGGAFNAIAPPGTSTFGELLETAAAAAGGEAELVWIDGPKVAEALEEPWDELPLWPVPGLAGLYGMAGERARAAGLLPRPLEQTVRDTAAWLDGGPELGDWLAEAQVTGLAAARERALLASLRPG